jgi:hypothetical protein
VTVESFRRGKVTKMSVISAVLRILENSNVLLASSQKEASFDSYLANILAIQASFSKSNPLGASQPNPVERPASQSSSIPKRASRRPLDDAGSDSEDEGDKPSKKQKLLESDMRGSQELSTTPPLEIATPVAKKPAGYSEPIIQG